MRFQSFAILQTRRQDDLHRKRVPICTPDAPSMNAAAIPLPSPMPPAALKHRIFDAKHFTNR